MWLSCEKCQQRIKHEFLRRVDTIPGLSVTNVFGYNPRSEVTEAIMGENTYGYEYDPIGNREQCIIDNGEVAKGSYLNI